MANTHTPPVPTAGPAAARSFAPLGEQGGQMVVMVDYGFLAAAAAQALTGEHGVDRRRVCVNADKLVDGLAGICRDHAGGALLRTYIYDAAPQAGRLTAEHHLLSSVPRVTLRLGRLTLDGRQKGVDTRMVLDAYQLAQTGTISRLYFLTGDDDISEVVGEVQHLGVSVMLFTVAGARASTSSNLLRSVDESHELTHAWLADRLFVKPVSATDETGGTGGDDTAGAPAAQPEADPDPVPGDLPGRDGPDGKWVERGWRAGRVFATEAGVAEWGAANTVRPELPAGVLEAAFGSEGLIGITRSMHQAFSEGFWAGYDT